MMVRTSSASSYATRLALAGALGCAVVALSCAGDATSTSAPPIALGGGRGAPPAGAAAPDDEGFGERFQPTVELRPCAEAPEFECGTLLVPVDFDAPGGETFALSVTRARATGERIGSLFVNVGGPSGFQTDTLRFLAGQRLASLRERFDLVTFDPRGTPSSTPEARCQFEPPPPPAPGDPAARAAYLDEHARRFADACLAQTGPAVTKIGTNHVARDIDLLRAALGEKTLSYLGFSYGAELGAVYASLFPKRVRAMVLDGGTSDTFADYTVEAYAEQAAATELALSRVDQLCQADPGCPLHETGLAAGLGQVLAALRANPVPSEDGTFVLDEGAAARGVYVLLIGERNRWRLLPGFVAAALAGEYDAWFDFAFPSDVGSDPYLQAYSAILCNDFGSRRPAADFLPALEAIESLYPVGRFVEFDVLLSTCQAWPAADPPTFRNVAAKMKTPILFIGNEFDPATPLNWTRHLARALGMEASVLRYEGGGHTVSFSRQPVPCIDDLASRYLFDLETPPAGASCPALPITFLPPPAPSVEPAGG
ncbi:MAG TPA: alpha/beta hydrolase [Polyangiaceae bacterium]|nr:alpha/beta hydrolase [Polyangiaceae bacterium]